jgi:hypothetical protein
MLKTEELGEVCMQIAVGARNAKQGCTAGHFVPAKLLVLMTALLLCMPAMHAQVTAQITGTVQDPSGG